MQGGGQSAEDVARRLGLRSNDGFGAGYKRVAKHALTRIFKQHNSVEAYVKATFVDLATSTQAGLQVKYGELLCNARSADGVIKEFRGTNPEELYESYVLELNVGQIGRYYYSRQSGNYEGATYVSGADGGLLPEEVVKEAQLYATQQHKLSTALGQGKSQVSGQTTGFGGGKGGKKGGGGFVPVSERQCHYCKKMGHLQADCPQKKADIASGKFVVKKE